MVGTIISHCEILEKLGQGGMGDCRRPPQMKSSTPKCVR